MEEHTTMNTSLKKYGLIGLSAIALIWIASSLTSGSWIDDQAGTPIPTYRHEYLISSEWSAQRISAPAYTEPCFEQKDLIKSDNYINNIYVSTTYFYTGWYPCTPAMVGLHPELYPSYIVDSYKVDFPQFFNNPLSIFGRHYVTSLSMGQKIQMGDILTWEAVLG